MNTTRPKRFSAMVLCLMALAAISLHNTLSLAQDTRASRAQETGTASERRGNTGDSRPDFNKTIRPLLDSHCSQCHGAKKSEGQIDFDPLQSWGKMETDPLLIEKMIDVLQTNQMPPEGQKQLRADQRQKLLQVLRRSLQNAIANVAGDTRFRMRRMNRFEYGNAVRDLFDLDCWVYSINDRIIRDHNQYFQPQTGRMPQVAVVGNRIMGLQQLLENRLLGVMAFPKDPPAENGFNNRGDHLSISPVLMQSFLELSRSVVNAENFDRNCRNWKRLFEDPAAPEPPARIVNITNQAALSTGDGVTICGWIRPSQTTDAWQTIVRREDGWRRQLLSIGRTGSTWGLWMGAGIDGRYVEFGAAMDPKIVADGQWHHVAGSFDGRQIRLYLDGQPLGTKSVPGKLFTGSRQVMQVGSYGDREPFHGDLKDIRLYGTGLTSDQVRKLAEGNRKIAPAAFAGNWKPEEARKPILDQPVRTIAHQRIEGFLLSAFRSPADQKTTQLYTDYFDRRFGESGDFTRSMKDVVSAALASPRFILVHNALPSETKHRDHFHLATRLSFFLWSSQPDPELLELASTGRLQEKTVLKTQVDRMLNHPRVKNFCDSFAPQWLKINNLVSASPDFKNYREYYFGGDDKISYKRGMHMMLEPLLNFETVFIENRPLLELVDSDFTYRSHLLSEWYQGRAATYPINVNLRHIEFKRTPLTDRRYGGVMTTSAVMVMTSSPFRSLPITRGSWVASVIFNSPPPPPPDNVPDLRADDQTLQKEGLTVREKLRQHSQQAQCAACHQKIDPFGFALENYDLLGRWREKYRNGRRVDASGKLFGKYAFQDIIGLKDAIGSEKEAFATAFVEHLLAYSLGRELTLSDRLAATEIAKSSQKDDYRMRTVIRNLVLHPVFRFGEPARP